MLLFLYITILLVLLVSTHFIMDLYPVKASLSVFHITTLPGTYYENFIHENLAPTVPNMVSLLLAYLTFYYYCLHKGYITVLHSLGILSHDGR